MSTERVYLEKDEISQLKIPIGSKSVIIKILRKNAESETPSGILKISPTELDWNPAMHSDRTGLVVAVPSRLPFNVGRDEMPWKTHVQIAVGMTVWFDFLASENCVTYIYEGYDYKVLDYDNLYVATLNEKIIPLNGFSLFERVYHKPINKFDKISETQVDETKGIVRYVAEKNEAYESGASEDHIDLQPGDEVLFGRVPCVMLEDEAHCVFDGGKMYRRSQSRNVEMLWRDGELIMPNNRMLVKQIPDDVFYKPKLDLILPEAYLHRRTDVKCHRAEVILSSLKEVPVGSIVKYIRGGGALMDYKGEAHRILPVETILYVE